ncbi:MAG: hypothetical protein HY654_10095, partial [Acidobacteria bacterium]|nr:hypothetical protein [Acidobacteriota bacterium]
ELRRGRLRKVRDEANTRFEAEQKELRAEIEKILSPELLKQVDELGRGFGIGRGRGRKGR